MRPINSRCAQLGPVTLASVARPALQNTSSHSSSKWGRLGAVLVLAAVTLVSPLERDASAQVTGLNPTAAELAQLPQFCWGQLKVPNAVGERYWPAMCGPGTNHYCPGLVWLIRAKRAIDMQHKKSLLDRAAEDIRYTERYIAPFPNCSIRRHLETTKTEVEALERFFSSALRNVK